MVKNAKSVIFEHLFRDFNIFVVSSHVVPSHVVYNIHKVKGNLYFQLPSAHLGHFIKGQDLRKYIQSTFQRWIDISIGNYSGDFIRQQLRSSVKQFTFWENSFSYTAGNVFSNSSYCR